MLLGWDWSVLAYLLQHHTKVGHEGDTLEADCIPDWRTWEDLEREQKK